MAAPTPTGAKYITMFVNLNIVSERLSAQREHRPPLLLGEERERDPEEDAEDDDLEDLALGHRLRHVLGEDVEDDVGERLLLPR